jgi:hypothetical protein
LPPPSASSSLVDPRLSSQRILEPLFRPNPAAN